MPGSQINRRQALALIAVTASSGTLVSKAVFAQSAGETGTAASALLMPGADVCVLTPEVTEGPYYFDPALERADITEGRPGIPTRLRLQIVDQACAPLAGARVDIWHCDATGVYSGYAGQGDDGSVDTTGETFMRGTQFADDSGIVEFATVYPSWYRGRTTHIHFKVFLDQSNILTGQIFFPDALSEYIYLNVAPYNDRAGARDTLNSNDSIANEASRASFAYIKELADEYLAAMIIGVDPAAQSSSFALGGPGRGDRRDPPPGGFGDGAGGPPAGGGPTGTADRTTIVPGGS